MTDTNVFPLSQPRTFSDPLTEVLRNGARVLLAQAVEVEVASFVDEHAAQLTEDGRRRLVRHGHLPAREIIARVIDHLIVPHLSERLSMVCIFRMIATRDQVAKVSGARYAWGGVQYIVGNLSDCIGVRVARRVVRVRLSFAFQDRAHKGSG